MRQDVSKRGKGLDSFSCIVSNGWLDYLELFISLLHEYTSVVIIIDSELVTN